MGQTSKYHLPWPELGEATDGPNGIEDLANALETALDRTISDMDVARFEPGWTGDAGTPQIGNGSKFGYYSVQNGWCTVTGNLWFGTGTNGASGYLNIVLPVAGRVGLEQEILAKLWVPGIGNFLGFLVVPPGATVGQPYFPLSGSSRVQQRWRSCDYTNGSGTGIPQIAGEYTVKPAGNLMFSGRYLV
jgi:hypothetical protein